MIAKLGSHSYLLGLFIDVITLSLKRKWFAYETNKNYKR